jgi:hypothetical protein
MAQEWEYKLEEISTEDEAEPPNRMAEELLWVTLRDAGKEGWELVAFLPSAPRMNPCCFWAVFKKPVE